MTVIVDSREQTPYTFEGYDVEIERGTLSTGDYSLAGYEDQIAIERKSLNDLVACLSHERPRFEKELRRARALDFFFVVVEASLEDIARGRYRSQMRPHAALQSMMTFMIRYRTLFVFAGSRSGAEYTTHALLTKYARERKCDENLQTACG
ncbi:MAG TPA: ERCC4 domain-containing protein [Syntrophobacter fumaroxidans]|nr:ERCC4 domain-containing protein [Syntrophobacter fumaroxidans]